MQCVEGKEVLICATYRQRGEDINNNEYNYYVFPGREREEEEGRGKGRERGWKVGGQNVYNNSNFQPESAAVCVCECE